MFSLTQLILTFSFTLFMFLVQAQHDPIDVLDERICNKENVFIAADEMPSFIGNSSKLNKELNQELFDKFNSIELEGEVFVRLVINCKNEAIIFRVLTGLEVEFDDQLLNALNQSRMMNNWKSGIQEGKSVDCIYNISFNIKDNKVFANRGFGK